MITNNLNGIEIYNILCKLKNTSSSKEKIKILEEYKDCNDFKKYLAYTYDKVRYTYGVTYSNVFSKYNDFKSDNSKVIKSLNDIEDFLKPLITRELTGGNAIAYVYQYFKTVDDIGQSLIKNILDRDIHAGINIKTINKVYKNLIKSFPYMRCSLTDKLKHIKYPALLQVKLDGTFRTFVKNGKEIKSYSRSGEEYEHPKIFKELENCKDGAYIGELIVNNLTGNTLKQRYQSNGLLNSKEPPHDVNFYCWDYLTLDEFSEGKSSVAYEKRYANIDYHNKVYTLIVNNEQEALDYAKEFINKGEEGAILKDFKAPYKNGTSNLQIKIKPQMEVDVRCVGFIEGKGRFENSIGSLCYSTDDNIVTGCVSGLTDYERDLINNNRNDYIDKIFTIITTSLSDTENGKTLLFPRFKEFRKDKNETDTYNRIKNMEFKIN